MLSSSLLWCSEIVSLCVEEASSGVVVIVTLSSSSVKSGVASSCRRGTFSDAGIGGVSRGGGKAGILSYAMRGCLTEALSGVSSMRTPCRHSIRGELPTILRYLSASAR